MKIDTSYRMFILAEFSIAPNLEMNSIFPFKKKKIYRHGG